MRVGIHFGNFTLPGAPTSLGPTLAEAIRIAEDSGVSVFTLMDHWFQMEMMATSEDPMLEGCTSLGFLAGQTSPTEIAHKLDVRRRTRCREWCASAS